MADRSFFVTISQRTHFFVFWGRGSFASPQHLAVFSERVSLIISLLISSLAFSFRFLSTEEQKNIFFTLAVVRWPLAVSRLKIAIKRAQSQACLGYAEREQFGRSQNGDFNTEVLSSPRPRCRSASFRRHSSSSLLLPRT